MPEPIRFAIIGCGAVARTHVRALADIPDACVSALIGRSVQAPRELANEFGLTDVVVSETLDEAIRKTEIDAVIIATPSGSHFDCALLGAKAGKHVIIEMPLEITPERCDRIIDACDSAGVQLATIFQARFLPANQLLKQAIEAGKFGRLTLALANCPWWRSQDYYDSASWRGTWAYDGGGGLMNQGIHLVDLLLWFMGPAVEVSATTATLAHRGIEVEDTAIANIRFANGALGTITASTAAFPGSPRSLSIHGDQGSVVTVDDTIGAWQFADGNQPDVDSVQRNQIDLNQGAADPKSISHWGHYRQLQDIVGAIRTGRRPAVDGHEGRKAVQLVCKIYEAARSGQRIKLEHNS